MTLLELNRELLKQNDEYEIKTREYGDYCKKYHTKIKQINDEIRLLDKNIDTEKIKVASQILDIKFPSSIDYYTKKVTYSMIYDDLIQSAKKDLISGCNYLHERYIGQKYYSGFDQREDCKYGYSPNHGNIYQRIGLKNPKQELSDNDIECCLYLLGNLDLILENLNSK